MLHRTIIVAIAFVFASASFIAPALSQQRHCPGERTRIVGGETARLANWPGQAAFRLNSQEANAARYFCGGTAIADRWVLTAAHCVIGYIDKLSGTLRAADGKAYQGKLELVLGAGDLTKVGAENVYDIERIVVHENYRQAFDNAKAANDIQAQKRIAEKEGDDIALVQLARAWPGPIAKLSLVAEADPVGGVQVRVSGFGSTEFNPGKLDRFVRADGKGDVFAGSALLRETAIETVNTPQCKRRYPASMVGPGQICAGLEQGTKDSCQGDSGGPLVVVGDDDCPRQVGIVSWGHGCAEKQSYGVYTRISHYADWIQKHSGPLDGVFATGNDRALTQAQLDEALNQLQTEIGSAPGLVSIGIRGGNRVALGQKVVFEITSNVQGRLLLLDIKANREIVLIYPNQFVPPKQAGIIGAGSLVTVPGPDYHFEAAEPIGKGKLLAIVVPSDFDIEKFAVTASLIAGGFRGMDRPSSYLMRFVEQAVLWKVGKDGNRSRSSPDDDDNRFGYALTEYEIVQ
jgi:secreted trypsin-like serine protease